MSNFEKINLPEEERVNNEASLSRAEAQLVNRNESGSEKVHRIDFYRNSVRRLLRKYVSMVYDTAEPTEIQAKEILNKFGYFRKIAKGLDGLPVIEEGKIKEEPVDFSVDTAEKSKLERLKFELKEAIANFKIGDWAGKTRIDPLRKAVKLKQESEGYSDESEHLPGWMSNSSLESGEAQFLAGKNSLPTAPVKSGAIDYKGDKSAQKLEADRAFVNAQWEKRSKGWRLPLPSDPLEQREEPKIESETESEIESVVLTPQAQVEKQRFKHDFLNVIDSLLNSGNLNRFEVFNKNNLAHIRVFDFNQNPLGEISLQELEKISGVEIPIPSFKDNARHKSCKNAINDAFDIFGLENLNVGIEIITSHIAPDETLKELKKQDLDAETRLKENVKEKPIRRNVRVVEINDQGIDSSGTLTTSVKGHEKKTDQGPEQKMRLNHPFFNTLFSLNGRSKNFQILIKAQGPRTVIKIIDRDPQSARKNQEIAFITIPDFANLLNLSSFATPIASGDPDIVKLRKQQFEEGFKDALKTIGISEPGLPNIAYQQF